MELYSEELCECYCLPEAGRFVIGERYRWNYVIDGIVVGDEDGKEIDFDEIRFLWYFKKIDKS